jgi:hypothetical protein
MITARNGHVAMSAAVVALSLAGCNVIQVHNAEKAKYAAEARELYGKVNLLEVVETKRKNLATIRDNWIQSTSSDLEIETRNSLIALLERPIVASKVFDTEMRERLKHNGIVGYSNSTPPNGGKGGGLVLIVKQLTEFRQADRKLREQESKILGDFSWRIPHCTVKPRPASASTLPAGASTLDVRPISIPPAVLDQLVGDRTGLLPPAKRKKIVKIAAEWIEKRPVPGLGVDDFGLDNPSADERKLLESFIKHLRDLNSDVTKYSDLCKGLAEAADHLRPWIPGKPAAPCDPIQKASTMPIGTVAQCFIDLMTEVGLRREEAEKHLAQYQKARQALEEAVERNAEPAPELGKRLKTAAGYLRKMAEIPDAFSQELAAEERLASLQALLNALATEKPGDTSKLNDPRLRGSVVAVASIPRLADGFGQFVTGVQKIPVSALLIERAVQEVRYDYAKRLVSEQEQKFTVRRYQLLAALNELELVRNSVASLCVFAVLVGRQGELVQKVGTGGDDDPDKFCRENPADLAKKEFLRGAPYDRDPAYDLVRRLLAPPSVSSESSALDPLGPPACRLNLATGKLEFLQNGDPLACFVRDVLTSGDVPPEVKRQLFLAISYAAAWSWRGRAYSDEQEMMLFHAVRESEISKSELSIRTWDAIIRQPLAQLALYHEGGMKPEEIRGLVTSIMTAAATTYIACCK